MTFVGKFFVVMQIMLSVTFMGFAVTVFTYQTDRKSTAEKAEASTQEAEIRNQNLQTEFDKFRQDNTVSLKAAEERATLAESARDAYSRNIEDLKNESQRIANDLQGQIAYAEIAEVEAEDRRSEAMTQRSLNKSLHTKLKDKTDESLKTGDELYSLEVARDALIAKNKSLTKDLAFLRKVIRSHKLETDPRIYAALTEPPPKLDGLVLQAAKNKKGSTDLIEISLGSDDGLVKGHILSVFRSGLQNGEDAKYLGQIKLVYVDSDQAVGTIIQKSKSGIIKRGDNVTTKL